jgi:uncharacterized membrane protein
MTAKIQLAALGAVLVLLALGMAGPGPLSPGLGPAPGPALYPALGPFGGVALVLVVAAIAIPFLARSFRANLRRRNGTAQPEWEEILRTRYAKGEIDRTQFMTMRNDLRDGGAATQ